MAKLFITYNLKAGVTQEAFETWVRGTDYPAMRGVTRVQRFTNNRTVRHLLGETKPSVAYIESFEIPDLDGFMQQDFPSSAVQKILGEFMVWVENPEFIVAEEVV